MLIPKRSRFEMFMKRKSSTSGNRGSVGNKSNHDNNNLINTNSSTSWSDICTVFIKDVFLRRRVSRRDSHTRNNNEFFQNDANLCLDQLSEFQKSYISFPEFSDSSISSESDNDSCNTNSVTSGHYWILSSSSSS